MLGSGSAIPSCRSNSTRPAWPLLKERHRRRSSGASTRDEWADQFADSDACVTPVLSPWEAHEHPSTTSGA